MKMLSIRSIHTKWLLFIATAVAIFSWSVWTNSQPLKLDGEKFVEGVHYEKIPKPIKLASDDKIEVMEVFWYGCGHCMTFESLVSGWKKNAADDVIFMRTPAVWAKPMKAHAKLYYVAETLGLPNEIHMDLFRLLTSNQRLVDTKQFAGVFARYGVDEQAFNDVFDAFGTKGKLKSAETRLRKNYQTSGTPEVIVNGKYRVRAKRDAPRISQLMIMEIVDFLIEKERQLLKTLS